MAPIGLLIIVFLCNIMYQLSVLILEKEENSVLELKIQKKETAQEEVIPLNIRGIILAILMQHRL